MKWRMFLLSSLILGLPAICFAQGKPDLTITNTIWRKKPNTVVIVVANLGKANAQNFVVGFSCQTKPDAKGLSVSYGSQYFVQELLPNQTRKITLDCKGDRVKGTMVDANNTVSESNESNNTAVFVEAEQKSGPIKKPGT